MMRWLLPLLFVLFASTAQAQITCPAPVGPGRVVGDTNMTLSNSFSYYETGATITAPRTWTLPPANTVNKYCMIIFSDQFGGVTSQNTVTIAAGANPTSGVQNTINGLASITMASKYATFFLQSDGSSKWVVANGCSGFILSGPCANALVVGFPAPVSSLTNMIDINVGGYPSPGSEIPASVVQGLSVKVAVPASFTEQPWPSTAISGYITNGNTASANSSVVALFGFAGQTTGAGNPGTPFGMNVVVANCGALNCANGSGFANGNLVGGEIDVDMKKIGAATPIGQLVGLFVTGGSEAVPSNGAYAIRVKALNLGTNLPWTTGFQTDNGAASNAFSAGAAAASGASSSQPINWSANNGSPIFMSATLDQNQYLEFTGTPDAGGILAKTIQARNAFTIGPAGSAVNVLSSLSGSNTTVYGDLGTAALVVSNTLTLNAYRNTEHVFQTIDGLTNFLDYGVTTPGTWTFGAVKLNLNAVTGAGASAKTVCVDSTGLVLLKAGAC